MEHIVNHLVFHLARETAHLPLEQGLIVGVVLIGVAIVVNSIAKKK
jgi:hypothetical protein